MAATYEAIATYEVGSGGSASIEFTSIPNTFTDLCVLASLRGDSPSGDVQVFVYFNGSTTSYARLTLFGDGSTPSYTTASDSLVAVQDIPSYTANTFSSNSIYIPNYNSSTNKSFSVDAVTENNATLSYAIFYASTWANTAAITSVKLDPNDGNLVQYSSATLYGIKNS